jgi:ABC-type transport system involved in multi-copper enzyme maturation permease subunit
MFLILRRDFKEMRSTTAFRIMIILVAFVTVAASAGVSIALRLQSWYGIQQAVPALDLILGLLAYFLPFVVLMVFVGAFASIQISNEKVNGNLESILATPISPKTLWMGKCLAIFMPAYLISIIATIIMLLVITLAAVLPGWGMVVLPAAALANGLIINPLLSFALLAFITLFSIANTRDIAPAPPLLVGFALMIGIPVGLLTGVLDLNSWSFALWYLVGAAVCWGVVLYLTRLLTRQNIVLSSKGS